MRIAGLMPLLLSLPSLIAGVGAADAQTVVTPGPYGVGFRVAYHVDVTREWSGGPTRGRPLRVYLWYPAKPGTGRPMSFGDYVAPASPSPGILRQLDSLLNARATGSFARWLGADRFTALKMARVVARLDATPAQGTFPVIAYTAGLNDSFEGSNSYLFEFLASQGFIVVTVPQLGVTASLLDLGTGAADLELQTRDLDQALGWLRGAGSLSLGSVIAMGHSMGGSVALLATMGHPTFRAVIGLDASYAAPGLGAVLAADPRFDSRHLTVPLLDIRRADSRWDLSVLNALSAAPRRLVQVTNMSHMAFTNDARVAADYLPDTMTARVLSGYEFTRDILLAFLKAVVSNDPEALPRFDRYLRSRSAGMAQVTIPP